MKPCVNRTVKNEELINVNALVIIAAISILKGSSVVHPSNIFKRIIISNGIIIIPNIPRFEYASENSPLFALIESELK